MTNVEGSHIKSIGYYERTNSLVVKFDLNAYVLVYENVPADVHAGLMASDKMDEFFHSNILRKYKFTKQILRGA